MSKKTIIGLGVLVVVVVLFAVSSSFTNAPVADPNILIAPSSTADMASSTLASTTSSAQPVSPKTPPSPTVSKKKQPATTTNKVTSPLAGDQWVLGDNHQVQWSEESLGNGFVSLINAQTGGVVGYITPSLALHQKSVSWNTKDVLLDRTGGQKKSIGTGQYFVKVVFEVGNKPAIQGGVFSVIYTNQKTVSFQSFSIQGYTMSPSKLTIKRGDVIYITNNDAISYKLLMSGLPATTVPANQTVKVDTGTMSSGYYEFYSDQYAGLKGGVTVQ